MRISKYRHRIASGIFVVLGIFLILYSSVNLISILFFAIAIGLYLKNEIFRKLSIFVCILAMVMAVSFFYPAFELDQNMIPFNDYDGTLRALILIMVEIFILLLLLLLKDNYNKINKV